MKHSDNGVALHSQLCGGKLSKAINDKGPKKGAFEIWSCELCTYTGRGVEIDPKCEELKAHRAEADKQRKIKEKADAKAAKEAAKVAKLKADGKAPAVSEKTPVSDPQPLAPAVAEVKKRSRI